MTTRVCLPCPNCPVLNNAFLLEISIAPSIGVNSRNLRISEIGAEKSGSQGQLQLHSKSEITLVTWDPWERHLQTMLVDSAYPQDNAVITFGFLLQLEGKTLLKRHHTQKIHTCRYPTLTVLEASFLMKISHNTGRYCVQYERRKASDDPTQL